MTSKYRHHKVKTRYSKGGPRGVKNSRKSLDIIYGRSLSMLLFVFFISKYSVCFYFVGLLDSWNSFSIMILKWDSQSPLLQGLTTISTIQKRKKKAFCSSVLQVVSILGFLLFFACGTQRAKFAKKVHKPARIRLQWSSK